MRKQEIYVILTECTNTKTNDVEIKISQEAYSTLEKAKRFLESRIDYLYKIDELSYESDDQYHFGFIYKYTIIPVLVV